MLAQQGGLHATTGTSKRTPIPPDVQAALNSTYADLRFIVVVNGPSMSGPVLLDNLRLASTGGDTGVDSDSIVDSTSTDTSTTTASDEVSFSFTLPATVALDSVVVRGGESVRISDAVHANNAPIANVVNMGEELLELGANATIDGNVYAFGDVLLRSRARIEGQLRAKGSVQQQNNVTVAGGIVSPANLIVGGAYEWRVDWPTATANHHLEPDAQLTLAPGSYGSLQVKSRAVLYLSSGAYYFDTFRTEPQAQIHVNAADGPVFIYVRSELTNRAQLLHSTSSADFFIAFAGEGVVELDGPFAGTVVAPAATIRLAPLNGGAHEGSFFALRVEAEARTPINFVSFSNWDKLFDLCPGDPNKLVPGICGCGFPDDDDDGDGVVNCKDLCPEDPHKVHPGITGCGNSDDLDADSDGIPDAIDPQPNNPSQEHSQQCDGAADGTSCNDGVCPGYSTCQNGQCGSPEDCRPSCAGDCQFFDNGETLYWICDCPVTWEAANTMCREDVGGRLLSVDTQQEQSLVSWLASFAGLSDAWMGANELTVAGNWHWAGATRNDANLFWVGGPDGRVNHGHTVAWDSGEPASEPGMHCGVLQAGVNGKWNSAICAEQRGFICEIGSQWRKRNRNHVGLPTRHSDCVSTPEYPTLTEDDFANGDYEALYQKCQEISLQDPASSQDAADARLQWEALGCDQSPLGSVPTENNCTDWESTTSSGDKEPYKIHPTQVCLLDASSGEDEIYVPGAVIGGGRMVPKLCETNSDCQSGHCGKLFTCFYPNDGVSTFPCTPCPEGDTQCTTVCGSEGECLGQQACGTLEPGSAHADCWETLESPHLCYELSDCELLDEMEVTSSQRGVAEAFEKDKNIDAQLPYAPNEEVPEDTDTAYDNSEFDDPCPGNQDSAGECTTPPSAHPWCHYNTPAPPEPVALSNTDLDVVEKGEDVGAAEKKAGFDFSPSFGWHYELTPGPLGFVKPALRTHAGVYAGVSLNGLFGAKKNSQIDIINAQLNFALGLSTTHGHEICGLSTEAADGTPSTLTIFNTDYLPQQVKELKAPSQEVQDKCLASLKRFENAASRAKKAMRDAQELLRQYRDDNLRPANGQLCAVLLGEIMAERERFLGGMSASQANDPGKALTPIYEKWLNIEGTVTEAYFNGSLFAEKDGFDSCEAESAERSINKFIEYYSSFAIPALNGEIRELLGILDEFKFDSTIYEWGDEKEKSLFNQTFMVGPVPCNLEVFISLAYGFKLDGAATFSPRELFTNLLGFLPDGPNDGVEGLLASLSLTASPYAAVRVGMFVGVGFDFGIVAAKIGIDGIVSIAEISVPGTATVGLRAKAVPDKRELSPELAAYSTAGDGEVQYWHRPNKLAFSLVYGADLGLAFSDILSGSIGLKLKMRFFIFSKVWRKEIAKWNGLCPSKDTKDTKNTNEKDDKNNRPEWCDIKLVSIGGESDLGNGFSMPFAMLKTAEPLVQINKLDESVSVAETQERQDDLDLRRVQNFGYNAQCLVTID